MIPSSAAASVHQYLRPEYLAPLPTTLDAKKSPLALLAQTCNQIGSDVAGNKPILSALESKSQQRAKTDAQREKFSPAANASSAGSSSNPTISFTSASNVEAKSISPFLETSRNNNCANNAYDEHTSGGRSRNAVPLSTPSSCAITSQQSTSPGLKMSSARKSLSSLKAPNSPTFTLSTVPLEKPSNKGAQKSENAGVIKLGSLPFYGIPTTSQSSVGVDRASPIGAVTSNCTSIGTAHVIHNHLLSLSTGAMLNPYSFYGHQKPSAGDHVNRETIMPLYRDPYCIGCRLGTHLVHHLSVSSGIGESCSGNCNQCEHHKAVVAAAVSSLGSQFAATTFLAQALPFMCNWVVGEAHCGRRFGSSEELLHHLTSHMNVVATFAASAVTGSTPPSAHAASIHPLLSPAHPLIAPTPPHLRSYPTPPLSPLGSRFHPYNKPQASAVPPPAHPLPSHSVLAPFLPFPPYL